METHPKPQSMRMWSARMPLQPLLSPEGSGFPLDPSMREPAPGLRIPLPDVSRKQVHSQTFRPRGFSARMQGSTCNFLEGLCVITEGFWIQEKERCSVNRL